MIRRKRLILFLVFAALVLIVAVIAGKSLYNRVFAPNVGLRGEAAAWILIPTGADFEQAMQIVSESGWLKNPRSFEWVARKKNYDENVRPGRYKLTDGMSNNTLVDILRSGRQDPVRFTFNNIRTSGQLATLAGSQLETKPDELLELLNDAAFLEEFGLTPDNAMIMFIPNTYEFYWNTDARGFIDRMQKEYKRFWNDERLTAAERMNFTPADVSILASIIQEETIKKDEMPVIAGVYINRLRIGRPLQADPTIKFALGDFSLRRILKVHLEVVSPYNTYKYNGLPPGPICLPEPAVIESVLNYERHNYLYFCAKDDFSGYHAFATNGEEHIRNARKYQRALNKRRILQ